MGPNKLRELSVFFPLHNEELNIKPLVKEALEVIPEYAEKFEILLINDGSTDGTKEIAEALASQHLEVSVINQENRGYGGALKTGFKNSRYEWVFYSDGDRQFNLKELSDFIYWSDTYNLIIGYRKSRAEGTVRLLITKGLKLWNKLFFNFPSKIKDIDCAFKLINMKVLADIGPLVTDGGMVSTEMLLKAHDKNHLIKQLPVNHYKREFGNPTGDSIKVIKKAVKETFELLKEFPKQFAKIKLAVLAVGIFLLLLPVALNINFMQNDDYTNYRLVEQFMGGDFSLDSYLGATFYLQGVMGMVFAFLFGLNSLPVLTLLVSVTAFYVFLRILDDFLNFDLLTTIMLGFLFFLNPLFLYSIWGFMTENYFMLFFLLSTYFILKFIRSPNKSAFMTVNILIVLSYFVRQFAFVTSAAFAVYLIFKKKFGWGFVQLLLLGGLIYYHFNVFPITPQMYDGALDLSSLTNFPRTFSLLTVFGIYLSIFTFPLLVSYFTKIDFLKSSKKYLLLLFIPFLILVSNSFEPKHIDFTARLRSGKIVPQFAKAEFPYLENVFGRKGFLENNLNGNKYHYPGFFDLFKGLDYIGMVGVALLLVILVINYRVVFSFSFIYLAGFMVLLVLAPKLFDRYLLSLIPVAIILLGAVIKKFGLFQKFLLLGYLVFLFILGYQYSTDFLLVNRYVWGRAEQLSDEYKIPREHFNVNHSWRSLYPVEDRNWFYYFEYSESKRTESEKFEVLEKYKIDFPLSFYLNPEITLFYRHVAFDN